MVIDVHNHFYPRDWLEFVEGNVKSISFRKQGETIIIYFKGTRLATIERRGHFDIEERLKDIGQKNVDVQILSLSTPSVELAPKRYATYWAQRINDYLASLCQKRKGKFYFYATLPLQDIRASVKEAERAKKELNAKGVIVFSNVCGKPIYFQEFYPLYETLCDLNLPVLIHPGPPIVLTALKRVLMPVPLFGFIFDTTLAVTGLIYYGVLERFKNLRLIHSHLGGVFPYLVGRIDDSFKAYGNEYRFSLKKLPSEYYRERVYVDSISFHPPSLRCALDYLGVEHILFGTDYPHPIGSVEKSLETLDRLGLSEDQKRLILEDNTRSLFRLD